MAKAPAAPTASAPTPASRIGGRVGQMERWTLAMVIPTETRPTTRSPSVTGATERTDRPRVPVYSSVMVPPARAASMVPR